MRGMSTNPKISLGHKIKNLENKIIALNHTIQNSKFNSAVQRKASAKLATLQNELNGKITTYNSL